MAIITVQHYNRTDNVLGRTYEFAATPDLGEMFPEGVKLDSVAMTLLSEYFAQIQSIGFGFSVSETEVTVINESGDPSWVGLCEYIEVVIKQAVCDSVWRTHGVVIPVG